MSDDAILLGAFIVPVVVGLALMMVPIAIAFWRGHPNRWIILIIAVVFGATILGWLIALVWSLHGFHRGTKPTQRGGASGLNLFADDVRSVQIVRDRVDPLLPLNAPPSSAKTELKRAAAAALDHERLSIVEAAELIDRLKLLQVRAYLTDDDVVTLNGEILGKS